MAPPQKSNVMRDRLNYALTWVEGVYDLNGRQATPSNPVWVILERLMDSSMSAKYIYQVVLEDRWKVASTLMGRLGIVPKCPDSESSSDSTDSEDDGKNSDEPKRIRPRVVFFINIPPEKWEELRPVDTIQKRRERKSGIRHTLKLPRDKWTHEVAKLICQQHQIPCAFRFNHDRVAKDPDLSKYFVHFELNCTQCDNEGIGYILTEPVKGETVQLELKISDTRGIPHSKKRKLGGSERSRVKRDVVGKSTAVYRRTEASDLMPSPGDPEPPILYSQSVYKQAKYEADSLDMPKTKDALEALQNLKYSEFLGSIHKIGMDPLEVRYHTPGQVLLNNTLKAKGYLRVCVDATGSLALRMRRPIGLSGHIFLYELVCNTGEGTAQLTQWLSEEQDASAISSWLNDWLRRGARRPDEAVCDGSKALISALCRSFALCADTKSYKERCFSYVLNGEGTLPACFIRLDLSHFIKAASKWKCWRNIPNKLVKDHYLRMLGLLIKSKSIFDVEKILLDILTLAKAPTYGSHEDVKTPAQEASEGLLRRIADLGTEEIISSEEDDQPVTVVEAHEEEDSSEPDNIKLWVQRIVAQADDLASRQGSAVNPYGSDAVATNIEEIAASVVMWSAVMVPAFKSPYGRASSAPVEGDFGDLKTKILKGQRRPMRADKLVTKHLRSINGQNLILSSKMKDKSTLKDSRSRKRLLSSSCEESDEGSKDLRHKENWRGRTGSPRKKQCAGHDSNNNKSRSDGSDLEDDPSELSGIDSEQTQGAHGDTSQPENSESEPDSEPRKDTQESENSGSRNAEEGSSSRRAVKTPTAPRTTRRSRAKGYLDPHPQIEPITEATRQPKNLLLRNGNLTGYFQTDKQTKVQIRNTCSFDAMAQVIAVAILEYPTFKETVKGNSSDNPSLKTVQDFAATGATKALYKARTDCLVEFAELVSDCKVGKDTRAARNRQSISILSYELPTDTLQLDFDADGNLGKLAEKVLVDIPCIQVVRECSSQHIHSTHRIFAEVNWNYLLDHGIENLQDALVFGTDPGRDLQCEQLTCTRTAVSKYTYADHIFVTLDCLQSRENTLFSKTYQLRNIPTRMTIEAKVYQLVGVVGYRTGHYYAYCKRRGTGRWELMDDCNRKIYTSKDTDTVTPHFLMYAR